MSTCLSVHRLTVLDKLALSCTHFYQKKDMELPADIENTPQRLIDGILHDPYRFLVCRSVGMRYIVFFGCPNSHIQVHPSNAAFSRHCNANARVSWHSCRRYS